MIQQHTIGKLQLDIQLPSRHDAFSLQNRLSTCCNEELLPLMGELFDQWTGPDTLLQIDKLEIDLGTLSREALQQELPGLIMAYLRKHYPAMQQQPVLENGMERIPLAQGYFRTWLYFLEHGTLPVTATRWKQEEWEAGILATLSTEISALQQCRELMSVHQQALPRLLYQFSRSFIQQWILAYSGGVYKEVITLITQWESYCSEQHLQEELKKVIPRNTPVVPGKEALYLACTGWLIKEIVLPGRQIATVPLLEKLLLLSFRPAHLSQVLSLIKEKGIITQQAPALLQQAAVILSEQYKTVSTPEEARPFPGSKDQEISSAGAEAAKTTDVPSASMEGQGIPPQTVKEQDTLPLSAKEAAALSEEAGEAVLASSTAKRPDKPFAVKDGAVVPSPEEGSLLYIGNAGLILLHPYLRILFEELDLLHGDAFQDEEALNRAVQLLGYLAYGENDIPEYDLLFPKLLCGLKPAQPVKRFVTLTDKEKEEADTLLRAVIGNWAALGETSPDGLRGNFLLREGRLEWRNEEWQLYVTQQAYDMLLNRLPWGFSVVGLSWMPWLIKTVWT